MVPILPFFGMQKLVNIEVLEITFTEHFPFRGLIEDCLEFVIYYSPSFGS